MHLNLHKGMLKRYVNNSKVQEHYAIILTKQVNKNQIESLSQDEQNIFLKYIIRHLLCLWTITSMKKLK